jgi:hypothetical protein
MGVAVVAAVVVVVVVMVPVNISMLTALNALPEIRFFR